MRKGEMPEGAILTKRKLMGGREAYRARRTYREQRLYTAVWPQDNLHEITVPKIVCIVSGAADFLLSNYSLHCSVGNFIFVPQEVPHQRFGPFLKEGKGHCELIMAYAFYGGIHIWYNRCDNEEYTNDKSNFFMIQTPMLAQLLSGAMEEAIANQADASLICKSYLSTFYSIAARELDSGRCINFGAPDNVPLLARSASNFADQVRGYIEANFYKPIRADDVARHLYMSDSYFFRQMHEHDLNFTELLTKYRMEFVCRLLRDTDMTVIAIKDRVSYKSSSHFQRVFRIQMGCTPLEYRYKSRMKDLDA